MAKKKDVRDSFRSLLKHEARAWGSAAKTVAGEFAGTAGDVATEFATGKMPKSKDGKKTITIRIVK